GFRHVLASAGIPGLILQLEDRTHGAIRDHPPALEVPRAIKLAITPDASAAGTKRLAYIIEVGAFASIAVVAVVPLLVPLLDDGSAHALDPHIDAAREERID